MTYSSENLDRIEAILAENARQLVETRQLVESNAAGLRETRAITDSNARAIEAWGDRIEEVQIDTEEATSSTRADLAVRIEDNAHNAGIDRARFDQLHEEHSQRFNNLLEEARADRQRSEQRDREWQERSDQRHREWQQRFDQAQAANAAEHRAFTQNVQVLLAEIARLWQRVAG
ncbi:MAG: hypothetical protein WBG38_09925 [Nodosilinea sp.]